MGNNNDAIKIWGYIALIWIIIYFSSLDKFTTGFFGQFQWIFWVTIFISICYDLYIVVDWFIGIYNTFFRLKNSSEATFNQIRVAMKKRLDLINQLRQSTESYSKYERGTFEEVTAMRTAVETAKPEELDRIDAESKNLLGRLFAVVENYPNLKASTLVTDLMTSIRNIEDEISQHRYEYNKITQAFNTLMDTIPTNIVGKIIGLKKLYYIDFEEEITTIPKISSLTNKYDIVQ